MDTFDPSAPIPRLARDEVLRQASLFPALVLTGARQTGKTTLLRATFPDARYRTLDLPSNAALAESDPDALLGDGEGPVIVDEVQYAPLLLRHLKQRIDTDRHRAGRFLMTGSQKFTLMQGVTESLAGRCAVFELDPLGARELAGVRRLDANGHAARLLRGGYPELWREPRLTPADFFTGYVATYLERDVRNIARVGSLRDFERFLRACALRTGQLLNLANLSRDLGIAQATAREWLSVLETSGTVTLLEPWSGVTREPRLRLVKSPKLYLDDTGLACFLLGIDTPAQLLRSPFLAPLWETWVLRQILIEKHAFRRAAGVFFFRDAHGLEVDFVLDEGGLLSLVECKWAENVTTDASTLGPMQQLLHKLGPAAAGGRHRLACRTPRDHALTPEIRAVDPDRVFGWFEG